MKILIDECLPDELKESVAAMGHECQTVRRAGYGSKKNGELLGLAEGGDFAFIFFRNSLQSIVMQGSGARTLPLRTEIVTG
jgi:hypothetical protein